jgi:HK97 family phage prohead protease
MNPKFQIFTGLLKAYEGEDGSKRFRTTASSTISDLAKDEILPAGIEQMAQKAAGNLTIFLNHEYRVPEDVLGSVEKTVMQTRGVDSEGSPIVDLDFDVRLNESNPRAVQTYEAIKSGVKLGTSIGAIVRQAEKKKGGGLRISELELLEASIVGIPANPRSWVQYAMKSINAIDDSEKSNFLFDEDSVVKDADDAIELIAAAQEVEVTEEEVLAGIVPDKETALCKQCAHAQSCNCADCSCSNHGKSADIEPDKEASTVAISVTVDSDSTQDASPSSPEPVLMDEDRADTTVDGDTNELADDVTMAAELDATPTEEDVLERLFATADFAAVVTKLQDVVKELTEKDMELRQTTAQRDELQENLVVAKEIIDRIADLPVGRKTKFSGAISDFRKRFPQYDEEFMKFLEK